MSRSVVAGGARPFGDWRGASDRDRREVLVLLQDRELFAFWDCDAVRCWQSEGSQAESPRVPTRGVQVEPSSLGLRATLSER